MGRMIRMLSRGDVWDADFDPMRGREQAGRRPAVIVSADQFHRGRSGLVYVAPFTRTDRSSPWQVGVDPPEGGLSARSFLLCDQVRVFAIERLVRWRGTLDSDTMARADERIRALLDL